MQTWEAITSRRNELAKVWRGAVYVAHSAATIVVVGPPADNPFRRATATGRC